MLLRGGVPVSEECIHRLEAAVSQFTDSRSCPLPGDEADADTGRVAASLQGGHSVCRLILVAASTAERTDAAQAAAQATTTPSAAGSSQAPFAAARRAPCPNRQNQPVLPRLWHDADRRLVVFSAICSVAFNGRGMTPAETRDIALALKRAFDCLLTQARLSRLLTLCSASSRDERTMDPVALIMATAGLRRLDLCMTAVFSREQAFAHTQHTIDAASLHHLLFAAVHQGRVWAARCTNGKLLKAARQLQETCAGRAQLRSAPLRISPVLVAVDARGDEEVMGKGGWWISFRRGPSKMACKLGVIIYVVLQFIAFFSVLIGTGVDMFYIKPEHSFGARVCITLWGGKTDCRKANVTISSDVRWKFCPIRRNNFRIGQAFAIISIFVYGAAFLFGFLLLYCCAGFRWLCLALNIVGAVTACVVWAVMVVTYRLPEPKCLELSDGYDFGTGFGLFVLAWILDIIDIIFLMLPWQIGEFGEARQLHDDALVEEPAELMPAGKTEGAEAADARP
ncbi:Amastin surface glycofamily protein [Leishmania donovani]|uniref:Amastin surface glycofamily protein n=1 Tax=Leishmania donovani TaxID=5661 RepID=A0A504XST3_LEIDO|nr:Amastin surface glycofamily protein [Leishmania donovani]